MRVNPEMYAPLRDWRYAADVLERLMSGCTEEDGCWLWRRHVSRDYPVISVKRRMAKAHRVAYLLFIGEVPEGLELDHLCSQSRCVNPWHLEPVTPAVNSQRKDQRRGKGWQRARWTHCTRGHAYTPENTQVSPRTGIRHCKACSRLHALVRRGRACFLNRAPVCTPDEREPEGRK